MVDGERQEWRPTPPANWGQTPELWSLFARWHILHLDKSLDESARSAAVSAIEALANNQYPECSFRSGQAVELLSKAVVARLDPTSLSTNRAPSRDFFKGAGHQEISSLIQACTVGARAVIPQAFALVGQPLPDHAKLDALLDARNASAHLGVGDDTYASMAARIMIDFILALKRTDLAGLVIWLDDPTLAELVTIASSYDPASGRHEQGWVMRPLYRIRNARRQWQRLNVGLPPLLLRQMALSIQPNENYSDNARMLECVTGGHSAWYETAWEEDEEQEYDSETVAITRYALYLDCPLCGLELDSADLHSLDVFQELERCVVDRDV